MSPEARPASCGRIPVTAAIVTGTNDSPSPTAANSDGPSTSPRKVPPLAGTWENQYRPPAISAVPTSRTGLKPKRVTPPRRRPPRG